MSQPESCYPWSNDFALGGPDVIRPGREATRGLESALLLRQRVWQDWGRELGPLCLRNLVQGLQVTPRNTTFLLPRVLRLFAEALLRQESPNDNSETVSSWPEKRATN